jgi:uncharacterized membrane protein YfhO
VKGKKGYRFEVVPNGAPRAYFVPGGRLVPDAETQLRLMASPQFDWRKLALLEENVSLGSGLREYVEVATDHAFNTVTAFTKGNGGLLVLTDTWFPGWRAYADGTRIPLKRCNYFQMAAAVPHGTAQVRFVYAPMSFYAGAAVSGVTWVGCLVALVVAVRRSRCGRARESAEEHATDG